ncbi:hypothetical protein SAMN05216410_3422 [Sanguibacter gelidistatuariae]|uniref:Integral membrane protein n=1 Tax=Sanguibacter gelidistatuariae TaxID=1814289 RepID=A0A1G6VH73_9MICO|nr:hypothetical protein [Sanguibacter gelidistatuariae]SDD52176.1 hypothetical protein SAMN05216410_3422 [Sanguibacter gelidistatuariae]
MTVADRTELAAVADCERVFRRNGLPMLVQGHTLGRDVFGRAAPFLLLVLLAQLSGAVNRSWSMTANVLAVLGGVVVVTSGYIALNRVRGRSWSTLPQEIAAPELTFFVLAPALLPLLFGGQWAAALATATMNVTVLALTWFTVQYGLLSTLWWGMARAVDELGSSLLRLVRLLPPLLIFSLVLFYNAEVWQVFDRVPTVSSVVLGLLFAALIIVLVGLRLPSEAGAALAQATTDVPDADDLAPLGRGQRINVWVMIGASQLLQVVVVCAGVFVFFVGIGVLTVTPEVQEVWAVGGGWSLPITLQGTELVLNQSLLRVSVAIATFTGLYFAISIQTDTSYRTEFTGGVVRQLRTVVAARVRYRELVG